MGLYDNYRILIQKAIDAGDSIAVGNIYDEAFSDFMCGKEIYEDELDELYDMLVDATSCDDPEE